MENSLFSIDSDNLIWLDNKIKAALTKEHDSIFGVVTNRRIEILDGQPKRDTPGACRFFMTRRISNCPHQLLFIGMNPSYARDFEGSPYLRGDYPESDQTASTLWKWKMSNVFSDLPDIGRFSMMNLVPAINPASTKKNKSKTESISETLEKLDCTNYFKRVLTRTIKAAINNFSGDTHIIRMWGKEPSPEPNRPLKKNDDLRWKSCYLPSITTHADGDPNDNEHFDIHSWPSVWSFQTENGHQLDYPPHPIGFERKGKLPAGIIKLEHQ